MAPKKTKKRQSTLCIMTENHDWGGLLTDLKAAMVKSISAKCELKEMIADLSINSDTFHPFNTEDKLAYNLPGESFGSTAEAKDEVREYLREFIKEMQENAKEHFSDAWNFSPDDAYVTKIELTFKAVSVDHMFKHFTFR